MEIIYELGDFPDPGDRDLYNGIQEINKNNYKKALEYFEKSSRYENEYGSLFAAVFHFAGFGLTERNPSKALELFKVIASAWNNHVAQYLIGAMYFEGDRGVTMDEEAGARWSLLAANNGWFDAMVVTGLLYLKTSYVGDKLNTIIPVLEKFADSDVTDAELINNSVLYLFGNKDFELSMAHVKPEIVSIINSRQERLSCSPIECIKRERDSIMPNSKELQLVKFWDLLTNKKSGRISEAQKSLAFIYYSEKWLLKDVNKALYWAKRAANNDEEEGFLLLGIIYSNCENVECDYKEAMKWFKKAASLGSIEPKLILQKGIYQFILL
ncbi:hypothetical protein EDC94DRAFT_670413 [Helicostylum pulchrum]|nr:hypothetical protein EDC94DRAFT_670413 [Helicostylum pulchrum]